MQEGGSLLDFVQHKCHEDHITAGGRNGYLLVAGLHHMHIREGALCGTASYRAQHLTLDIGGQDHAVFADDLGRRYGEEAWSTANVGHSISPPESQPAQERFGVQGSLSLLAQQFLSQAYIEFLRHNGLLVGALRLDSLI